MFLFVGLGNPGASYAGNRHNIGFMAIEAIARTYHFSPFKARFKALVSEGVLEGEKILLLMPQTYMNLSGQSVGEAMRFYKIPLENLIVLHDELDLPLGKIRIKRGGGNAGHNGLRSLTSHVGNEYKRLRLGIGHPGDKALVHDYVLSDFRAAERTIVSHLCDVIADEAPLLMSQDDAVVQNKISTKLR